MYIYICKPYTPSYPPGPCHHEFPAISLKRSERPRSRSQMMAAFSHLKRGTVSGDEKMSAKRHKKPCLASC